MRDICHWLNAIENRWNLNCNIFSFSDDFRENSENFRKFSTIFNNNLTIFLTMFIQEHFSVLRRLTYPDADVFIICFSIIDPYSFKRVQTKWVKELSEYCPNTPVVLVGTKYDQRNNINTKILLNKHGLQPVSSEQGEQVARKIGAKQVNSTKIFIKN